MKLEKLKRHVKFAAYIPEVSEDVVAIVEKMMAREPEDRFATALAVARALKPLAVRKPVKFDFRHLVTLRAKQARAKDNASRKSQQPATPRSSITSASAWLDNPSRHLQAEIDTFAGDDTPAIRQPAPPVSRPQVTAPTQRAAQSRPSVQTRTNVPSGWFIRRLKSKQLREMTSVKTRVGTAHECEITMTGTVVDERQCSIEFDGGRWQLKQESKTQPTFVNGDAEVFVELRHRSRVTFSDGSGFELLSESELAAEQKRRNALLLVLALGFGAGIVAVLSATLLF